MTPERLKQLVELAEFVGDDSFTMFTPYRSGKVAEGLQGIVTQSSRDGASVILQVTVVKKWLERLAYVENELRNGRRPATEAIGIPRRRRRRRK